MSSFFYAYASKAGAKQSRPDWFGVDPATGEDYVKSPRVLAATDGVWLELPTGAFDDNGDWQATGDGVRSDPYVILSPFEDGAPAKLIEPAGRGGFA